MKVQNKYKLQWESLLFIGLLTAYFIGFLLPLIFTACENVQIASVLYPDEERYVKVIRGALEAENLRIHFVSYGHFFFNLVLIPLLFLQQFFTITDVHILLSLRLISWLFALGSVVWVYVICKRFFGVEVAWLSAFLMLLVPLTFTEYAVVAHPDTLQLFFILGSLYHICLMASEKWNNKHLVWASVMAGFAFSAKYAGILLLPLIAVVFLLQLHSFPSKESKELKVSEKILERVKWILGLLAVFCVSIAFLLQKSIVTSLFSADGTIESKWIWNLIEVIQIAAIGLAIVFGMLFYFYWRKVYSSKYIGELTSIIYYGFISATAFLLAFIISSPNSLLELQVVQGLIYEGHNTRTGGFFTADWSQIGEQWYAVLTSEYLLGQSLMLLGLGTSLLYFVTFFLQKRPK